MLVRTNFYISLCFFILLRVFTACGFSDEFQKTNSEEVITREKVADEIITPDDTLSKIGDNIEVVLLDSTNGGWLERLFVVADSNNISFFKEAICFLKDKYNLDERVSISFFSEKKYANYVSVLFSEENGKLSISEYENWMNHYYLAEYDFESNAIVLFPGRDGKKEKTTVLPCE